MAERPVFVPVSKPPYYRAVTVPFTWNAGLAKVVKQRNVKALHAGFSSLYSEKKVLEISSKSMQENGDKLSAFALPKFVPSLGHSVTVECVYHSSKTFTKGGPYTDLLEVSSHDAKTDERLKSSGAMTCYTFEGRTYPLNPKNMFYNYIYINALLENSDLAETILQYDAFTDIEFNPNRSINCQAAAAAAFRSLSDLGLIDQVRDFDSFCGLFSVSPSVPAEITAERESEPEAVLPVPATYHAGDSLTHKVFGTGTITEVGASTITVVFPEVGEKHLGQEWCRRNCS